MAVNGLGRPWIEVAPTIRSDLAPEQRVKAMLIGRIGFTRAGAKRKPKEAVAA